MKNSINILMTGAVAVIIGVGAWGIYHPEEPKTTNPNTLLYGNERRDERAEPQTGRGGIEAGEANKSGAARMDGCEGGNNPGCENGAPMSCSRLLEVYSKNGVIRFGKAQGEAPVLLLHKIQECADKEAAHRTKPSHGYGF